MKAIRLLTRPALVLTFVFFTHSYVASESRP
jgi:hypothetical protein